MKDKLAKGLEGVYAVKSSISHVDGKKGKLVYRGYSIKDLAEKSTFEEVIYLLWYGKLAKSKELSKFKKDIQNNYAIHKGIKQVIKALPKKDPPMSGLRTCVSLLANFDSDSEDISVESNKRKSLRIMASMPTFIAAIQRVKDGKSIVNPRKGYGIAKNFLYMLYGKVPSREDEKTMDVCLILHAEHGLNASTFASRVTVATLSDMHSGIVSAIGTLKGPLHGGANKKAIQSLHHLGDELKIKDACKGSCLDHVDKYVLRILKNHERIMGIGHRVYKVKDPRAIILEEYARKTWDVKDFHIAKEIEKVMIKEKKMYPNVDFFSGIVYENLKIPVELYVCIFALSRTSGWLAHIMEQYSDNRLIRPLAQYDGNMNKRYIPINRR